MDPSARFEIGSVTKLFTGRLLRTLADEGLLALDEPARDVLGPGWRLNARVTLESLARHRSGLPRTPRRAWRSFMRSGDDPWRAVGIDDLRRSLPPKLPRLRWFRYSNFGAALLGHALATRAGEPWEALLRSRITEPLGLRSISSVGAVAQPHRSRGKPVPPWTFDAVAPAGALRSTAEDLLAFLAAEDDRNLAWLHRGAVAWHNGGTGGSSAFVSREPPIVLLTNSARAQQLTALGLRLAAEQPAA